MQHLKLLKGKNKLFLNLYKGAERKLYATGAQHVVFGVVRDDRGHLSTFFYPCDDEQLSVFAYMGEIEKRTIYAVHR